MRVCLVLRLLIVSISYFISVSSAVGPVVNTSDGKVSGKTLKSFMKGVEYQTFLGIPFAAPPLKDFRFLPPQPLQPWDDVLATTKNKPACVQFNRNVKKLQPLGVYGEEDCLYLDVFTPNIEKKNPVMVFIYNQNFMNSYNKTRDYAPDFFIEEGVVVVTVSHRLSVFGFLTTEDDVIPANAGLKDIVAGLEWVQKNIALFGGDPKKVTLVGFEGGAVATDLLVHSTARNLFHSAILQDGSAMSSFYLQEGAKERAFKFAESLGKNPTNSKSLLLDLKDVDVEELLKKELNAMPDDYFKDTQRSILSFGPIVQKETDLVAEYPEHTAHEDIIPIMIGFNSRTGMEASQQYLYEPNFLPAAGKHFSVILPKRVNFRFNPVADVYIEAVKEIMDYYFPNGKITTKNISEYITYMTDVLTYSVSDTVKMYSNISKNVFYYHFDYFSSLNENKLNLLKLATVTDETWGAASGDEMCYLFKCPDLIKEYKQLNSTESEGIVVQRKLVKMWANFVKFGNPTPDDDSMLDGLTWKPYTTETKDYLHIGKTIEMKTDLHRDRFGFWDRFIEKWGQLAVNGVVQDPDTITKDEL